MISDVCANVQHYGIARQYRSKVRDKPPLEKFPPRRLPDQHIRLARVRRKDRPRFDERMLLCASQNPLSVWARLGSASLRGSIYERFLLSFSPQCDCGTRQSNSPCNPQDVAVALKRSNARCRNGRPGVLRPSPTNLTNGRIRAAPARQQSVIIQITLPGHRFSPRSEERRKTACGRTLPYCVVPIN